MKNLPTQTKHYMNQPTWQDEYLCTYTQDGCALLFADDTVREVVVREGTEVICDEAFAYTDLEAIHLPLSINAIGTEAFLGCRRLRQFVVTGLTPIIRKRCFEGCDSLRVVELPEKPTFAVTRSFGSAFVCTHDQRAFLDNVWYFINRVSGQILLRPEVAMARIPYDSGTNITGSFYPTLGAMIRWWMFSEQGNVLTLDGEDRDYAICSVCGSLLTGVSSCLAVDRKGNYKEVEVHPLREYYQTLREIQNEFDAKYADVEALTFSDALALLKELTARKDGTYQEPQHITTHCFITGDQAELQLLHDMILDTLVYDGPDDDGACPAISAPVPCGSQAGTVEAPEVHRFLTKLGEKPGKVRTNALCFDGLKWKQGALHFSLYSEVGGCQDFFAIIKKHFPSVEIFYLQYDTVSGHHETNDSEGHFFDKDGHYIKEEQ